MRLPRECYQMQRVIETHLPHLTQSQLTGLALVGLRDHPGWQRLPECCRLRPLAPGADWNNLRQYLREWLYDGGDRASVPAKAELDVSLCFAPLLQMGPCMVVFRPVGAGG